MADALLERPDARLAISSLATSMPRELMARLELYADLPGELACADEWHAVAAMLDRVAAGIAPRMRRHGAFSQALAAFVAGEVRGAAADIRANLALEERDACITACRHD